MDEYSELDRQVQSFEPKKKRHEALKKEIKGWYENHAAEGEFIAEGNKWNIHLTAKSEERSWVSKFKLARALGRAKFYELLEVAFGKAEEVLGKDAVSKLVSKERTGSRRLKPVLRAEA